MTLLQPDAMSVTEYNNINTRSETKCNFVIMSLSQFFTFRGIIYKYMIYLKHLFSDFKHVMICVAMAYLMVIDTLLFITRMWAMSDLSL